MVTFTFEATGMSAVELAGQSEKLQNELTIKACFMVSTYLPR